jgi:hypothetical protein
MGKIYKSNGEVTEVEPKNGKHFTLEELQEIVGGYFEPIYLPKGMVLAVNEEGLLKNLPFNEKVSNMTMKLIVGDVLLCNKSQLN